MGLKWSFCENRKMFGESGKKARIKLGPVEKIG